MIQQEEANSQYISLSPILFVAQDLELNYISEILGQNEIEYEKQLGGNILRITNSSLSWQLQTEKIEQKQDSKLDFFLVLKSKKKEIEEMQIKDQQPSNLENLLYFLREKILKTDNILCFTKKQTDQVEIQAQFLINRKFIQNSESYPKEYDSKTKNAGLKQLVIILESLKKVPEKQKTQFYPVYPISSTENINVFQNEKGSDIATENKILPLNLYENEETGLFFDLSEQKIIPTQTPKGFNGQLKNYQKLALTWMLYREGVIKQIDMQGLYHCLNWLNMKEAHGISENIYINKKQKKISLKRPIKTCDGGILADQMGLGKTIMMISLILFKKNYQEKPENTLIVGPVSILKQWEEQIKFFASSLSVFIYNSSSKKSSLKFEQYDVVITSKDYLRCEKKIIEEKNEYSVNLFDVNWTRVILDEAHNFKNSKTKLAQAACELDSMYRWCLTGTPAQNSFLDIYSLLNFLKYQPWQKIETWKKEFPDKIQNINNSHYKKIKNILRTIMIRRKKKSKIQNGLSILELPKVNIKVHLVEMSKKGRKVYQFYKNKAYSKIEDFKKIQFRICRDKRMSNFEKSFNNKLKRRIFLSILGTIYKLRQICCHQFLYDYRSSFVLYQNFDTEYKKFISKKKIKRKPRYNFFQYYFADEYERRKLQTSTTQLHYVYQMWNDKIFDIMNKKLFWCPICKEKVEDGVITPCTHIFCKFCIQNSIKNKIDQQIKQQQERRKLKKIKQKIIQKKYNFEKANCPECGQVLMLAELFHLPVLNAFNQEMEEFQLNEKIRSLLSYLFKMEENDKAIIYTSFLGMVALLEEIFKGQNLNYLTMKGSDSVEERSQKMKLFSENPQIKIFVITLGTGAVGINLQAANKVFFMDPWWNPAIEKQAISRVHRYGQEKEVQVIKFITKESIEARIMKLAIKKKELADSILDIDDIDNNIKFKNKMDEIHFLLNLDEEYKEEQNLMQDQASYQMDAELENSQQLSSL